MAVGTPTTLFALGATANTVSTGSYTPSANSVLIARVDSRGSSATLPSISDTGGTWNLITGSSIDMSVVASRVWYMDIGATPPTLDTTGTKGGGTQVGLLITEFTGGAVELTNFPTPSQNAAGDGTITFANAFGTGSAALLLHSVNSGGAIAAPSGFTKLNDSLPATNLRVHSSYDLVTPTVGPHSYVGGGTDAIMYGLEIKEASSAQTITGALFEETNTFFASTITPGVVTISGALFSDADIFFAATISQVTTITGALFTDADTFFAATLTPGPVTITGALYTDADTFFAATVTPGAVTITGALFTDTDTFFASSITQPSGGGQTITGDLFTDADTFFAATLTTGVVTVAGALFTDADTFFVSTITPGVVSITGTLFIDPDTFFGATVSEGGGPPPTGVSTWLPVFHRRRR